MTREWTTRAHARETGSDKDVPTVSVVSRVIIFSSGSTNFDTYHIRVWLFTTTEKNNGTKEKIEIIH